MKHRRSVECVRPPDQQAFIAETGGKEAAVLAERHAAGHLLGWGTRHRADLGPRCGVVEDDEILAGGVLGLLVELEDGRTHGELRPGR